MRTYLQAVFNEPIGVELCMALEVRGFDGIRADLQHAAPSLVGAVLSDARNAGLEVCAIICDGLQLQRWVDAGLDLTGVSVELRNEPDLEGPSVADYRSLIADAESVADALGVVLYVGSISNLNQRGFTFLQGIIGAVSSPETRIAVHRYPAGGVRESLATPHPPSRSRLEEVQTLIGLIGHRRWAVTQTGYHTAPRCAGAWFWRRCHAWTDAQVRALTEDEWVFWRGLAQAGPDFAVAYQLNDGNGAGRLDRYGIRRTDGTWKPVADAFSGVTT